MRVCIIDTFSIDEDDASYLEREQEHIEELLNSDKAFAKEEGIDHVETHMVILK